MNTYFRMKKVIKDKFSTKGLRHFKIKQPYAVGGVLKFKYILHLSIYWDKLSDIPHLSKSSYSTHKFESGESSPGAQNFV